MSLRPLRRMGKRIGFRMALWYSTIFVLSSLLLFALAYLLLSSSIHEKDREMIEEEINEYVLRWEEDGMEAALTEIRVEQSKNEQAGFFVRVADPHNQTLLLTMPPQWKKGLNLKKIEARSDSDTDEDSWISLRREGDEEVLEIASHRLPGGYTLQVGRGSGERDQQLEHFREVFVGIMIPVILVGFAGGSFLGFRAFRPIRDLIQTVRSIDTGKMDARVPSRQTGDELDELAQLFNGMLERIQTLIAGMREALDNVAHDLRTPVARLRGVVETGLQSECDEAALREALMDCAEESERIVTMLNTLMDISEAETGTMKLDLGEVNLTSLIEEVTELYQYVAEDKGIGMAVELPEELYARVDPNRIRQVIANLLDNALKYTPGGGRIEIEACQKDDEAMISIRDTGAGISPHDLPKIFDRLYRGDKSRSQRGLGLGLSLVRAVTHAHKGRIEVESHPGQGSQFTLFLPADPQVPH